MYASVRPATGEPGSMGEIARIIEDGYTDRLAQIPGFEGYYVVDAGNDQVITISLFDDETGADKSANLARELVGSRSPGAYDIWARREQRKGDRGEDTLNEGRPLPL